MSHQLATQQEAVSEFNPFKAIDRLDDEQILAELEGRVSKVWVYQFQQDGKTVEGLSKVGVDQACIDMSMQGQVIREGDLSYQQDPTDPKYMLFSAFASKYAVSADGREVFLDKVIGTKRQCIYITTKSEGVSDRVNPFWYEQGAMKAMRNARMRLITEETRARIITLARKDGKTKTVNGEDTRQVEQPKTKHEQKGSPSPADKPGTDTDELSPAQGKMIHTLYDKLGLEEERFHPYISEVVGRTITTKQLTKPEASKVIDKLVSDLSKMAPANG